MAGAVERFGLAALAAGLEVDVVRYPEGTRTAADAAAAVGCDIGQIVKSMVFMAGERPFLALTSGSNQADPGLLADLLGVPSVRRATPDEAREATGFAIGGTPPFGHPRPLRVFVDRDLLRFAVLWAAAGAPDAVFPISPQDLVKASEGEPADFKQGAVRPR
jgi:prolyl-tRNA editing enzyme YbaK/EbsC (Cys-tRNA(Pro) deacylase)